MIIESGSYKPIDYSENTQWHKKNYKETVHKTVKIKRKKFLLLYLRMKENNKKNDSDFPEWTLAMEPLKGKPNKSLHHKSIKEETVSSVKHGRWILYNSGQTHGKPVKTR